MKKMSLQEIQSVSLDILKYVHAFCEEHSIKYSLGYGSLIGAVRHKGFIPWDDDIDIVMMRNDFDSFCQSFQDTPDYKLFSFTRGNMYASCARVCEMKRTLVKTGNPLFTEQTGVWIDVFPLDSVDDDRHDFESKIKEITDIQSMIYRSRTFQRRLRIRDMYHIKAFFDRVFNVGLAQVNLWDLVKRQDELCRSFATASSKMMSLLVFPTYIHRDYTPKNVFDEVVDATFENSLFKIMKGYDKWLTIIYGDYMKPPSNTAKRGHTIHQYYWR